jgi:uncharacterized protein YhbP (UPF0306 family)
MARFTVIDWLDLFSLPALTLATTGPHPHPQGVVPKGVVPKEALRKGEPHAAVVYFVALGEAANLRLYFFSDPHSQHGQDLLHDPRAAAALFPLAHGWQDIRGLQLRGQVKMVFAGEEWDAAWAAYAGKFPFVVGLKSEIERNSLYALIPSWLRLVDNQRGFGYKEEWTIP